MGHATNNLQTKFKMWRHLANTLEILLLQLLLHDESTLHAKRHAICTYDLAYMSEKWHHVQNRKYKWRRRRKHVEEPRSQATGIENSVKFVLVVFEIREPIRTYVNWTFSI